MDRRWAIAIGTVVLLLAVWNLAFFTVPVWMQAIVVQLGEPVRTIREPGLYFKIPFIQNVQYFDRRLLEYDASPKELLTRDKQQLVVDNYTRWKIVDPLKFFQAVRDEGGAQSRLDDIVYSNLRENFGRQTLIEIVSTRREPLMEEVTRKTDEKARDYGIEVVELRIKRAELAGENKQNVSTHGPRGKRWEKYPAEATGSQKLLGSKRSPGLSQGHPVQGFGFGYPER